MITELFIEDRRVDISADISTLLTFAIDDVRDFSSRQTTFSKTVVIPGTANNNALLGNIFDTAHSNSYNGALDNIGYNFNASVSARCIIFQDYMQTFKGTVRLLRVVKNKGVIEYEVALNGELTSLNVSLSSGFLTDLDFSAYDLTWNETNIVDSWDNVPGSGVYFPLMDYGGYSTLKHDWDFRTFRPALYVKEYIDKIFTAANFRYECDLFSTDRFKSLVIPHNQKKLNRLTTQLYSASRSGSTHLIDDGTAANVNIPFATTLGTAFTPSLSNTRFTYNQPTTLNLNISYSLVGNYVGSANGYTFQVLKNGSVVPGTTVTYPIAGNTFTQFWNVTNTITLAMATGDYIEFNLIQSPRTVTGIDYINAFTGSFSFDTVTATLTEVAYNTLIQINQTIPQNIRQIDFLVSIIKLFNLYVYEDRFDERLIKIKPYVDFYSTDSTNAVDWTYKLNRDETIVVKPMSELNAKTYKFNYKDDNDYYNELYKKRYNEGYGSFTFDSQYEFTSQEKSFELIFAGTPLVGYASEDKVYSTIFKRSGTTEEQQDSVIRILQTKKITGVSNWDIKNGISTLDTLTVYGYAGHLDDPDNPTNDINFGAPRELFFTLVTGDLSVNQFNVYWSPYMAEITDKDSKMLMGKFYLTPKDIYELDLSKYVFLDGVLFRINKIEDYNASTPSDCSVELIKTINTIY